MTGTTSANAKQQKTKWRRYSNHREMSQQFHFGFGSIMPENNFLDEILEGEPVRERHHGGDEHIAKDEGLNEGCGHEVKTLLACRVEAGSG